MNVAETGSKPAGTALPCGFGDFGVAVATAADEAVGAGDAALAGAVVWLPGGVAVAPTLGPVAPGRTRMASATIATPAARRPKTEPIDRLETRCRIPVVQADGSRDGISDTRATRRSGAGSRARS